MKTVKVGDKLTPVEEFWTSYYADYFRGPKVTVRSIVVITGGLAFGLEYDKISQTLRALDGDKLDIRWSQSFFKETPFDPL